MVIAAERAYREAVRGVRRGSTSPRRGAFARRATRNSIVAGIAVMGVIGLVSPSTFGSPEGGLGWPTLVTLVLVMGSGAVGWAHRNGIRSLIDQARAPYLRPQRDDDGFDDAADALASCPAPYRTRFAMTFVYRPVALAVLGVTCAFSTAYFIVDAVLARFSVGWGQPVYAAAFLLASLLFFYAGARKLATWRVAASVHKEVTTGY